MGGWWIPLKMFPVESLRRNGISEQQNHPADHDIVSAGFTINNIRVCGTFYIFMYRISSSTTYPDGTANPAITMKKSTDKCGAIITSFHDVWNDRSNHINLKSILTHVLSNTLSDGKGQYVIGRGEKEYVGVENGESAAYRSWPKSIFFRSFRGDRTQEYPENTFSIY